MHSTPLVIGLVQFDIAWESPEDNMHQLDQLLQGAVGYDLFILPEMWSTGFTMQPEKAAELHEGPAFQWMKKQSNALNTTLMGSLSIRDKDHFVNRLYVVFPDGAYVMYDKKHLFSYGKEDQHYHPGSELISFELNDWKIMPLVCYDLRFPVWCRNVKDYDLLILVANWPAPRIHHWDALLRARAIENQCYVAGVNRIGVDGSQLSYSGHSCVYDMNGQQIMHLGSQRGIGKVVLDKEGLMAFRERFPFLSDRDPFQLD